MQILCKPASCAKVVQTEKSGRDLCKLCARIFRRSGQDGARCRIKPRRRRHGRAGRCGGRWRPRRRQADDQAAAIQRSARQRAFSKTYSPHPVIKWLSTSCKKSPVLPRFPERVSKKISKLRKNSSAEFATAGLPAADVAARPRLTANETGCAPRPAAY